ncbi:MAG: hypothetical protein LW825_00825 [Candidatus Jidaibacter sp.]|jgi:hypothetical protein|nr:hypothetical protein [Candidatus Jidaibacter sp.]
MKENIIEALVDHLQSEDSNKGNFAFDATLYQNDVTPAEWMEILKSQLGTDSTILFELAAQGELAFLTYVVSRGGFHYTAEDSRAVDIDLNQTCEKHGNKTAYAVCVGALSNCKDADKRAKLEGILSILEAGGVDTWVANFLYNFNNKSAILAKLAKGGVGKVADAAAAVDSTISDKVKGNALAAASAVASATTYLLGAAYNSLPESEYVNYMKQLYGAINENVWELWEKADTTSLQDIYKKLEGSLPVATRVSDWKNRSKVLADGDDKYKNLLAIVRHASAPKIEETFFWMSRQTAHVEGLGDIASTGFNRQAVQDAFIEAAAANTLAPQAGVIVLKQIFAYDPSFNAEQKYERVIKFAKLAREHKNGKLLDELYQYVKENFAEEYITLFKEEVKGYEVENLKAEKQDSQTDPMDGSFVVVNPFSNEWEKYKKDPSISIAHLALTEGRALAEKAAEIGRQDIMDELASYGVDISGIKLTQQKNNEDYYVAEAKNFTTFMAGAIAGAIANAAHAAVKIVAAPTLTPTTTTTTATPPVAPVAGAETPVVGAGVNLKEEVEGEDKGEDKGEGLGKGTSSSSSEVEVEVEEEIWSYDDTTQTGEEGSKDTGQGEEESWSSDIQPERGSQDTGGGPKPTNWPLYGAVIAGAALALCSFAYYNRDAMLTTAQNMGKELDQFNALRASKYPFPPMADQTLHQSLVIGFAMMYDYAIHASTTQITTAVLAVTSLLVSAAYFYKSKHPTSHAPDASGLINS